MQKPEIEYKENFSSVVHFESVHSVIKALLMHGNMKSHHMDVKIAF